MNSLIWLANRFAVILLLGVLSLYPLGPARAQQSAAAPPSTPPAKSNADFLAMADEVLHEMSAITGWDLKSPLKKSIRSREQIRAYVLRQMDDDKDAKERYASKRSAEAFGLIPKGFDLDSFMVDLLTEQIAGLYDPKAHEFYIADWIAPDDQRTVMAHELTHALEDQHFQIEAWVKAARPNDDAELARESVLEGSAMAAMLEYMYKGTGLKIRDLPAFDPSAVVGDLSDTPMLKKAPRFIKDSLTFPYFSGLTFSLAVLKTEDWKGFSSVFARPPANTQQIIHPNLYQSGKSPTPIKLELPEGLPGSGWTRLEENSLGEFGLDEVLKQFLDADRAGKLAASWNGDMYATYESKDAKRLLLFVRVRLDSNETAARFFGQYSEALEKKYAVRTHLFRRPDFFSFDTPDGGVFLRCFQNDCISVEGGDRSLILQWNKKLGWEAIPEEPLKPSDSPVNTTQALPATAVVAAYVAQGESASPSAFLRRPAKDKSQLIHPPQRQQRQVVLLFCSSGKALRFRKASRNQILRA